VGTGCLFPRAELFIRLIFGEIAVKPVHVAFSFKGKDMCCDPVKEPSVMADNNSAAPEVFQRPLKDAQGIYIKFIGGIF
jgi:hypothetical protein